MDHNTSKWEKGPIFFLLSVLLSLPARGFGIRRWERWWQWRAPTAPTTSDEETIYLLAQQIWSMTCLMRVTRPRSPKAMGLVNCLPSRERLSETWESIDDNEKGGSRSEKERRKGIRGRVERWWEKERRGWHQRPLAKREGSNIVEELASDPTLLDWKRRRRQPVVQPSLRASLRSGRGKGGVNYAEKRMWRYNKGGRGEEKRGMRRRQWQATTMAAASPIFFLFSWVWIGWEASSS